MNGVTCRLDSLLESDDFLEESVDSSSSSVSKTSNRFFATVKFAFTVFDNTRIYHELLHCLNVFTLFKMSI